VTGGEPAPGVLRVARAGDAALVAAFPARIDPLINERAAALAAQLRVRWGAILRDVVVGYCTVTVYFDPLQVDARWLEDEIRAAEADAVERPRAPRAVVQVPVCYQGDFAPDLEEVAVFGGCLPEEVAEIHAAREYRVYMVGFIPGFAYMAEVDPRIAAPRKATPRAAVPAGSVGIAAGQTGIYPAATPGGWNIIGRTPLKPYDASRPEPFLFRTGDRVRFVPVARDSFGSAG
jgi:inhibitor of KinA